LSRVAKVSVLFCAVLFGCSRRTTDAAKIENAAAAALRRMSQSPNTIPDAALNLAHCAVLITSNPTGQSTSRGVAICRDSQQWASPWLVTFSGRRTGSRSGDLLFLILGDAAARKLRSGHLIIESEKLWPAPLANTRPILTQRDLARDALTYVAAEGVLSPSDASGVITGPEKSGFPTTVRGKTTEQFTSALVSFFNHILPTGIVIHHTAVLPNQGTVPSDKSDVDQYHASRGFEIVCEGHTYHVAYHYLILRDGRVQSGRPERCQGAHAPGYNSYLGISVVGDFSSRDNSNGEKGLTEPTTQQLTSLLKLCRELQARYGIPLQHIVRHSDISSTECPGNRFPFTLLLKKLAESQGGNQGPT
jgi:N-acetylmuramoyl-L-alanine amidase